MGAGDGESYFGGWMEEVKGGGFERDFGGRE